jgi:hypothetical protein
MAVPLPCSGPLPAPEYPNRTLAYTLARMKKSRLIVRFVTIILTDSLKGIRARTGEPCYAHSGLPFEAPEHEGDHRRQAGHGISTSKNSVSQKGSQVRAYPHPQTRSARKSGRSHVQPRCCAAEMLRAAAEQVLRAMRRNEPKSLSAALMASLAVATLPSAQKRSCGPAEATVRLPAGGSQPSDARQREFRITWGDK